MMIFLQNFSRKSKKKEEALLRLRIAEREIDLASVLPFTASAKRCSINLHSIRVSVLSLKTAKKRTAIA